MIDDGLRLKLPQGKLKDLIETTRECPIIKPLEDKTDSRILAKTFQAEGRFVCEAREWTKVALSDEALGDFGKAQSSWRSSIEAFVKANCPWSESQTRCLRARSLAKLDRWMECAAEVELVARMHEGQVAEKDCGDDSEFQPHRILSHSLFAMTLCLLRLGESRGFIEQGTSQERLAEFDKRIGGFESSEARRLFMEMDFSAGSLLAVCPLRCLQWIADFGN